MLSGAFITDGSTQSAAPSLSDDDKAVVRRAFAMSKNKKEASDELTHPVLRKVAEHAVRAAYAHNVEADSQPVTRYARAKIEHLEGSGNTLSISVSDLARGLDEQAQKFFLKGEGPFFVPGGSRNGRRRDEDCVGIGWLFLDSDNSGDWHALLAFLSSVGAAFIVYRTASHKEDAPRWRVGLPLRSAWIPTGDLEADRRRWKGQLYLFARVMLGAIGELSGVGFDPATDGLLNRFYPPSRRPGDADTAAPEVRFAEGRAFDIEAMFCSLSLLGVTCEAERPRSRRGMRRAPQHAEHDGLVPPLVAAFEAAGLYVGPCTSGKFSVECPWASDHTTGSKGDTSTVIFAGGNFFCSHSHCLGKKSRDVLDALPANARAAYARRVQTTGVAALRAQLCATTSARTTKPVALHDARAMILDAVKDAPPGLTVVQVEGGVGKSHQAREALALRGEPAAYAHGTHAVGDEAEAHLQTLGVKAVRRRGVLSVKNGVTPVCIYPEHAKTIQRARGSVPKNLCIECEHRNGCPARPVTRRNSHLEIVQHEMLAHRYDELSSRLLVIDESFPLTTQTRLTAVALAEAEHALREQLHRHEVIDLGRTTSEEPSGGRFVLSNRYVTCMVPLVSILRRAAARGDGSVDAAANDYAAEHCSGAWGNEIEIAIVSASRTGKSHLGETLAYLSPKKDCIVAKAVALASAASQEDFPVLARRMRRFQDFAMDELAKVENVLRTLSGVRAAARSMDMLKWSGDDFRGRVLSQTAAVVQKHPRIVMLDATAPLALLGRIRPDMRIIAPSVAPAVKITRSVLYNSSSGKRALASNKKRIRALVAEVCRRAARSGVTKLLLVTFKDAATYLNAGDILPLTEWRSSGRLVDIAHYGAVRGLNAWKDFDGCVTIGDPWPNIGDFYDEATFLGVAGDGVERPQKEHVANELAQCHFRLRDVSRDAPAWHLHVGGVAPGGWGDETVVDINPRGRPPVETDESRTSVVRGAVERFRSQRFAARALGVPQSTLRGYLQGRRTPPLDIIEKCRAVMKRDSIEEVRA